MGDFDNFVCLLYDVIIYVNEVRLIWKVVDWNDGR